MEKLRVSVFIPAYNEEVMIATIVRDMLSQDQKNFILDEIVVATDGCTDETAARVKAIGNPLVKLIESTERRGKAFRINEYTKNVTADLIVQADADTTLAHPNVLSELIAPYYSEHAKQIGMTCGNYVTLPPENFMQTIAGVSLAMFSELKDHLGEKAIRYRCNGRLLSIPTHVAQSFSVPGNVATDVYTFFSVVSLGYNVVYCEKAVTNYYLVDTLGDFIKQNKRYHKDNVRLYFPDIYKKYTTINLRVKIVWFIKSLFRRTYPLYIMMIVAFLYQLTYFISLTYRRGPLWPVSLSSKRLSKNHVA
jgi:glycosyltransferase involved in cell wall biosynthesis